MTGWCWAVGGKATAIMHTPFMSRPLSPVFMTAAGPRMLELAGEVADGALMLVGLHPQAIAAARQRLEIGARRAGRDLRDFQTIFITPMTVDVDGDKARRWPQQWLGADQPYFKYPQCIQLDLAAVSALSNILEHPTVS